MSDKNLKGLKAWLIVHFVIDVLFAIPLMFAPVLLLELFGWNTVDPVTARIAAAALFGIGIQSLIATKAPINEHRGFLNLKIIWSFAAVIGIILSLAEGTHGNPPVVWGILVLFIGFNVLWTYFRIKMGSSD